MKYYFLPLFALFFWQITSAQSITGTWQTIDDNTGKAKGHIQLFESNGKTYGKLAKLLEKPAGTLCDKCPDERKNQPLLGMVILTDMVLKDGMWQSGSILDPEKGKWYNCKLWIKEGDPNTLVVRGSVGPFYRTQYWHRLP